MKNFKLRTKLLSLLTSGMILFAPVAANSESNEKENTTNEFRLVEQTKSVRPMTMVEYVEGIQKAYTELSSKINYANLQGDLQCLYYLTNRSYLDESVEDELINKGIVFETHLYDEMENFSRAINLINVINDYNQSTIVNSDNIDDLFNVSVLCYDEKDKELVNDIHVNYFNAYKNGRYYKESFEDNEAYRMLFKQLTTLNAAEKAGNADELAVGVRWTVLNTYGVSTMEMLCTDMQEEHKGAELAQFFNKEELNQHQFIIRNDIAFDLDRCIEKPDLQSEVEDYGMLWHFVIDTVHNDIFKTFDIDCTKSK